MSLSATVIVPTFNEESDIAECLSCVAAQDVGAAALEVLMVDGGSLDHTVERATAVAHEVGFGRFTVLHNPAKRTAAGLSLALSEVTTGFVVRVDARSRIPKDYLRTVCAVLAQRPEVGVVGGAQVPVGGQTGTMASGIARALSNRFTTGLSRYRRSSESGPADTVWMGAFRADELVDLGGWDPEHGINEDYELNRRYREAGKLVWYESSLRSGYFPRRDLASLTRQYLSFGRSKGDAWARGARPELRHVLLIAGPPLAGLGAAWVARSKGLGPTMAVGVASLALLDAVGASSKRASIRVRVASLAATVTFAGAWWAGTVDGWLRGVGRRQRVDAR
jgi:glycosyltransferase involved in cell wall biosynthesis